MREACCVSRALHRIAEAAVPAFLLVSLAATAQLSSGSLQDEQIRAVVSAKTLALRFAGTPTSNPLFFSNWDFRGDGSLCARLIGSAPGTECAEVGKWWVQASELCWQLPRIGASVGVNSACGAVRKGAEELYEIKHTAEQLGTTVFSVAR